MLSSIILSAFFASPIVAVVIALLVLSCGVLAIVASSKGSLRYRYFLGALGVAILISFAAVWLQYEVTQWSLNNLRYETGFLSPDLAAGEYAFYFKQGANLVLIGTGGLLLALISLLVRKHPFGSTTSETTNGEQPVSPHDQ